MKIKIKKKFLIFREEAQKMEKISKKELKHSNSVCFDFSEVSFVSRSFVDELLNILAKEKRIKIVNLKPNLNKFLNIVKKTKRKTTSVV